MSCTHPGDCLHCTFSNTGHFCTDQHCTGPGCICTARTFTEGQIGYVAQTCTDARCLRAQVHGDARTECGAPLERNCTEAKLETRTLSAKSGHGSHATSPNILLILRCNAGDSFGRHCGTSSRPTQICTDWHSLKPPLHRVARTGCEAPLARS